MGGLVFEPGSGYLFLLLCANVAGKCDRPEPAPLGGAVK